MLSPGPTLLPQPLLHQKLFCLPRGPLQGRGEMARLSSSGDKEGVLGAPWHRETSKTNPEGASRAVWELGLEERLLPRLTCQAKRAH